jgi:hypothetical protein
MKVFTVLVGLALACFGAWFLADSEVLDDPHAFGFGWLPLLGGLGLAVYAIGLGKAPMPMLMKVLVWLVLAVIATLFAGLFYLATNMRLT